MSRLGQAKKPFAFGTWTGLVVYKPRDVTKEFDHYLTSPTMHKLAIVWTARCIILLDELSKNGNKAKLVKDPLILKDLLVQGLITLLEFGKNNQNLRYEGVLKSEKNKFPELSHEQKVFVVKLLTIPNE